MINKAFAGYMSLDQLAMFEKRCYAFLVGFRII